MTLPKRERVLLDSNLLLLLVASLAGIDRFAHHKRLNGFDLPRDLTILHTLLSAAAEIVVTPHTLTETSNLLRHIGRPALFELSSVFAAFIKTSNEISLASHNGASRLEFIALGLTDAVLLHLASDQLDSQSTVLVTADFDLYIAATEQGMPVINFNELRDL